MLILPLQKWKLTSDSNSQTTSLYPNIINQGLDKNSMGWSWLERWMAAKPWETRLMEQSHCESSETTPLKYSADTLVTKRPKATESSMVKVRKNNVTTRVSAKPTQVGHPTRSSSSPSSECHYDESSPSSSFCTSTTPASMLYSDRTTDDSTSSRPNYMNLTESIKLKQKANGHG